MDNECSYDLQSVLTNENIDWQLVPLHNHRANAAEQAIQTFKHHFKACLATINPNFPMCEWDRLLVQAELTLHLLQTSNVNPSLSAYAYLFGNFNYNRTPLVPPETKVITQKKLQNEQVGN